MNPRDFALIVLASGLSERFGSEDKLLARLNGKPLIGHVIDRLARIDFGKRYAVICEASPAREVFQSVSYEPVLNPDPALGQGHALYLGASKALEEGFEQAVIVLGDMPFIETGYVVELMTVLPGYDAVFSVSCDVRMPPIAVGLNALNRLSHQVAGPGGKQILEGLTINTLPLSARSAKDIDTRQDLIAAEKT